MAALKAKFQQTKKQDELDQSQNSNLSNQQIDTMDSDLLKKRLNVYHRINELYQEESLTLEKLMKGLLDIVVKALAAECGSLWIVSEQKSEIICHAAVGVGSKDVVNVSLAMGKGIVGWSAEQNKTTIVYDASKDERFCGKVDRENTFITKSIIAAPLYYGGEVIGVIEVINKKTESGQFDDTDKSLLEDVCTPTAMHIKTSMVKKQQEDLVERMNVLKKLHENFSSTMDLNKLLGMVLNQAIDLIDAEVGSVWLLDETSDGVECKIAEGPTKNKVIGVKVEKGSGIIGWVVANKKAIFVEDCSKDDRFSKAVDEKINFATKSMIAAPLTVQGECIGAIQILNKKGEHQLFKKDDLNFLGLFADSSAMYIKNAKLFESEKKAKELSALITISKEITSTLDIDSVLMSIVNLSNGIIQYEKAVVSTESRAGKKYEVRSISGQDIIDKNNDEVIFLAKLHNEFAKKGGEILINDTDEYLKKEDSSSELKTYIQKKKLASFWSCVFKDDQGELGVLSMESLQKNMVPETKKELLSILVSQSTVALRNAQLYTTIPKSNLLGSFGGNLWEAICGIKDWTKEKQIKAGLACSAGILALVFLKIPYNVSTNIEVIPVAISHYAQSKGKVSEVFVHEGQDVNINDPLVKLDVTDLVISLKQKESTRQKVISEMLKLQSENKISEFKIKENEKLSLDTEVELVERQLENSTVVSMVKGIVVSEKLDELVGKPIDFGQELIKVASKDKVYVQFEVSEDDVPFVNPGQDVKFKVFGYPNKSFSSGIKIRSIAGEGQPLTEADPAKFFMARAEVHNEKNDNESLRPGMTGRGKIYTSWQSLGYVLFSKPLKFIAMKLLF